MPLNYVVCLTARTRSRVILKSNVKVICTVERICIIQKSKPAEISPNINNVVSTTRASRADIDTSASLNVKTQCRQWETEDSDWDWLLFGFLRLVELFSELVDGILSLLAHRRRRRLALNLGFLELTSQLRQLSFTLLVNVDLQPRFIVTASALSAFTSVQQ